MTRKDAIITAAQLKSALVDLKHGKNALGTFDVSESDGTVYLTFTPEGEQGGVDLFAFDFETEGGAK